MEYTIAIILLALLQFIYFTGKAGFTRVKHGVDAPSTTGNIQWECFYRVQQNTMEQLVIFIPAMLTFHFYVSQKWVVIPGVIFIVGRGIYSHLYSEGPRLTPAGHDREIQYSSLNAGNMGPNRWLSCRSSLYTA